MPNLLVLFDIYNNKMDIEKFNKVFLTICLILLGMNALCVILYYFFQKNNRYNSFNLKKQNKLFSYFPNVLITILLTLFYLSVLLVAVNYDYFYLWLSLISYSTITFFSKSIVFIIFLLNYNLTVDEERSNRSNNVFDFLLSFLSPDYYLTKITKSILNESTSNRSKSLIRAAYIELNNYVNIIITFFLALLFIIFKLNNFQEFAYLIFCLLICRILSRCFEIIVSFVNDVTSKNGKQSSLRNEERIHLAFKSLLEICVFAFCTLLMFQGDYQNTQDYYNVIQSLLNSINVLIGDIIGDNFSIKNVFLVIESIACASLIGLVITTYTTSDENYINMDSAPSPYLFVVSNGHISIFTMQLQKNGCYSLIVTEENFANHSFQVFNANNRIVINNELIKNNRNGSYSFKDNGIYEITYCEHLNKIDIKVF